MKTAIVVYALSNGKWVETIKMKLVSSVVSEEMIQNNIDEIHKLFYNGDKVQLKIEGQSVSFRGLDKQFSAFKVVAE